MTKNEYINELKKELKQNNVEEIDDIILEYTEHFDFKMEEGFTEEEIAKKLSSPKEIAKEYNVKNNVEINKFEKGIKTTGVVSMTIPLVLVYALMLCSCVVLVAFSLVCAFTGFCLLTTINIAGLIPYIPYFSSFLLSFACFGLSILCAVGTFYSSLYVKQWGKIYIRCCKNIINNNHALSISKHPKISKKLSSNLKLIAIIGLIVFVSTFTIGYLAMCITAKNFEPWHVFNWFV